MQENLPKEKTSEAGFFCPAYVGLRGVLLIMVLEGHYWFDATSNSQLHILTFAVPCFFALSGYLISHTLFSYQAHPWKEAAKVFYARRALRILPPFYLVLLVAHLVGGVPYLEWQLSYLMNVKIFLLSAYKQGEFWTYMRSGDFKAIHYWSVNVEEQFYIFFPLFVAWTVGKKRLPWYLGAIGLCILCRAYLYENFHHSFYGGLSVVTGEYILWGSFFAWLDHNGKLLWLRNSTALYSSVLLFIFLDYHDTSYGPWAQWKPPHHQTVYCILIATFILSLRYCSESWLAKFLSLRPLAVIGQMSYGAYLIHLFLNPSVDRIVEVAPVLAPFETCPRAVVGPILTLSVSAVMWYGFEEPINRARHRFRLSKQEAADEPE